MTNPIDVERRFQDLLLLLSLPSSPRQRLTTIAAFLTNLGDDLPLFEPYALDLAQRVPGIVQHFQADGSPPDDIRSIYAALSRLPEVFREIHTIAGYDECLKRLRDFAALQYAFVGMLAESLALYGLTLPDAIDSLRERPPLDQLRQTLNEARARKHESALHLAQLLEAWEVKLSSPPNYAIIPVVEKSLTSNEEVSVGRLRGVTMELFGEVKSGSDDIRADVSILENSTKEFFSPAVAAARSLIRETHPSLAKRFVAGRVQFEEQNALHEGRSANLAIALLLYCEILRHANQRVKFRLSTKASFTGNLGESGGVLPVDSATLASKIEAAFFSWIDFMVIPKPQKALAEDITSELQNRFPSRRLTLLAVENTRDVFYDRRLTDILVVGPVRHFAGKVWGSRWRIGVVLLLALLVIVFFRLLYGPLDTNPRFFKKEGDYFVLQNKYKEKIGEMKVGLGGDLAAVLFDVDNDGTNELIYERRDGGPSGTEPVLQCRRALPDSIFWEYRITQNRSLPVEYESKDRNFFCRELTIGDLGGPSGVKIIGVAISGYSPCFVFQVDPKTGVEIGRYYHYGHLGTPKIVDLDGDGLSDVVLAGVNNWFNQACLVVLDPRFLSETCLLGHPSQTNSVSSTRERYYIRIPTTLVGDFFRQGHRQQYNLAAIEEVREHERKIRLRVEDVRTDKGPERASIYIHFRFDLIPIEVRPDAAFANLAGQLYERGDVPFSPDSKDFRNYFHELPKTLLYWNGTRWLREPAMNKNYLEALAKAGFPRPSEEQKLRDTERP